ncbi:TIGR03862 family flavoprotein [Qingshengfaniella alkalisoli]|uniref:TIGR03862 family flavoprotein n=1 Tax=Qingshengfaniella alkalisoli TaxID=2599296 RepID=A0A5B8IWT9_9RHOB|nr:TIGR03862 family flavoprotein [Qingshengfaniella alkalisoli]QDY70033.1 TIGR03862 family flavoprotein [Qingshengfaniella alkalisoli]
MWSSSGTEALVIGAGPAGLMAADILSARGKRVTLVDAKPSPARKFLMAGKSGLNLTRDEPHDKFVARFSDAAGWLKPMIDEFGPDAVQSWARSLGQEVFAGSTGKVFPLTMKASPLLRAWLARLGEQRVELRTRWRWQGWEGDRAVFDTPKGKRCVASDVTVLATGGASWARLGSDGAWVEPLRLNGVPLAPFAPSNVGVVVPWSDHMRTHFGSPVKNVALIAGDMVYRGEFVVSERGFEGGGIYDVSPAVREGSDVIIDLLPDIPFEKVADRLSVPRGKLSRSNFLRRKLGLDPVKIALLHEFGGRHLDGEDLVQAIKRLPMKHCGLGHLDEAISVAGGVTREAVDGRLMLIERPGVYCCGEMLDWDAPTGGYLLTACLATGRWAGLAAADRLDMLRD